MRRGAVEERQGPCIEGNNHVTQHAHLIQAARSCSRNPENDAVASVDGCAGIHRRSWPLNPPSVSRLLLRLPLHLPLRLPLMRLLAVSRSADICQRSWRNSNPLVTTCPDRFVGSAFGHQLRGAAASCHLCVGSKSRPY